MNFSSLLVLNIAPQHLFLLRLTYQVLATGEECPPTSAGGCWNCATIRSRSPTSETRWKCILAVGGRGVETVDDSPL